MTVINYLKGDATSPQTKGNKIIGHVCNDIGGWGKGFVVAISKRWKEPEKHFREWYKNRTDNNFALGEIRIVQVSDDTHVANMIGQKGIRRGKSGPKPVRYEAISKCLEQLAEKALEMKASVHMPRIGCGLAGGDWDKIEPMIIQSLSSKGIDVYIYDFG